MLFCCKLVFAVNYMFLGQILDWKTCLGKKKMTFSMSALRSTGNTTPLGLDDQERTIAIDKGKLCAIQDLRRELTIPMEWKGLVPVKCFT